jgi:SsrA-binding protein
MAGKKTQPRPHAPRVVNKKARREYHVLEVVHCGLALTGTEVKALRQGAGRIDQAHARVRDGEVFLIGATIAHYAQAAPGMQHEPARDRKLLLHKRQIARLAAHARQPGRTLVPLAIYFQRGWAKCELALAVGKRAYDKRQDIKKRQQQRDIERELRRR